ncbi:hypothetical protein L484_019516 [Morus notabilis]|uniref:Uncharacterized protein n=1 Tax=Morus notabilis TaxID=981085 RepID=W9RBQ4_9ROSA|nr:hypothetical protein L484_019516 [Morus notabilis]
MVLRGPGRNRSWSRGNPDILIMMIAEKQIMRGGEDDKEVQREGRDGPSKACNRNEWHCTQE